MMLGKQLTAQRYRAFLSYSHRDKTWADWLHRRLETYEFPKTLTPAPEPIRPIFRDREDLSAAASLSDRVQEALANSDCLIILCSENAATSDWVNKEIGLFRRLHPEGGIFPVIISGEPHAEKMGFPPALECFPPALRYAVDPNDPSKTIELEPLAADLRKDRDGKHLGVVKLVSGIANIRPDELIQRDLKRARKRLMAVTVLSLLIVSSLSLLSAATLMARNVAKQNAVLAEQQRDLAETRRDEAEGLIEFMLGDLRQELEPLGRLGVLTDVADRALDYYSQPGTELTHCTSASGLARAKYLHTRIAVDRGDFKKAREYSDDALTQLDAIADNCRENEHFIVNHSHAIQWSADLDILTQDEAGPGSSQNDTEILKKYTRAKENLIAYSGVTARPAIFATEKSDAEILIGKYYIRSKNYPPALTHFQHAETILKPLLIDGDADPLSPSSDNFIIQNKHADVLTWISGAYEGLAQYDDALGHAQQARKIYLSLNRLGPKQNENWDGKFNLIGTDYAIARLFFKQGKTDDAIKRLESLETDVIKLVSNDPSNIQWKQLETSIMNSLAALKTNPPP